MSDKNDKELGRALWLVIHRVAAAYPVTEDSSATKKKLWAARYLAFFTGLQYVLPHQSWRETLYHAMPPTERDMREINESSDPRKALRKTMFELHDRVRRRLGQPIVKANWLQKYGAAGTSSKTALDPAGVRAVQRELAKRDGPMDEYLRAVVPDYGTRREYMKEELRRDAGQIRKAAEWWWKKLAPRYAAGSSADTRKLVVQSIVSQFPVLYEYPSGAIKNVRARVRRQFR